MVQKREQLGTKIDPKLIAKVRAITVNSSDPYAPTITQMVERGLVLAIAEYEARKKKP